MKKILCFLLALLAFALTGCGPRTLSSGGKVRVVATIFPPYDFARAIAGGRAELTMLLPPASESHSFEPTPQDVITIQNCDVFIYVGGESDAWVGRVLDTMDTARMRVVTLMDCVETVREEIKPGMQAEAEEDPEYDEHVWTSPRNAGLIVQKISAALCAADPANAAFYQQNTAEYLAQLEDLDAQLRSITENAVRKTLVFGDRFPFRYFADAYGLDYAAAFPGCSTETEASAATLARLVNRVKAEHIPVVFHIELSNGRMAQTIADAAGAKVLELHSCHNISKADFNAGVTYLDLMRANAAALKEALQ